MKTLSWRESNGSHWSFRSVYLFVFDDAKKAYEKAKLEAALKKEVGILAADPSGEVPDTWDQARSTHQYQTGLQPSLFLLRELSDEAVSPVSCSCGSEICSATSVHAQRPAFYCYCHDCPLAWDVVMLCSYATCVSLSVSVIPSPSTDIRHSAQCHQDNDGHVLVERGDIHQGQGVR